MAGPETSSIQSVKTAKGLNLQLDQAAIWKGTVGRLKLTE